MSTTARVAAAPEGQRQPAREDPRYAAIATQAIAAFDEVNGKVNDGFRPTHAKGILLTGVFTPAPEASELTSAVHVQRSQTAVTARFSDFGGAPTVSDGETEANPRGLAIRFHLAEHTHTDLIGHSINGFPTRTAEDFVSFLCAIAASKASTNTPSPIETFLATHPAALRFVQTPQPLPFSFAAEEYFAVNAYRFINDAGVERFGRYRIRPEQGAACAYPRDAASHGPNYLFDEIRERILRAPVRLAISVQIAGAEDVTDDATVQWPEDRCEVSFGTLELNAIVTDNASQQKQIIFDPIPRTAGIEPSADPLLAVRAATYLMSGRRRRSASGTES